VPSHDRWRDEGGGTPGTADTAVTALQYCVTPSYGRLGLWLDDKGNIHTDRAHISNSIAVKAKGTIRQAHSSVLLRRSMRIWPLSIHRCPLGRTNNASLMPTRAKRLSPDVSSTPLQSERDVDMAVLVTAFSFPFLVGSSKEKRLREERGEREQEWQEVSQIDPPFRMRLIPFPLLCAVRPGTRGNSQRPK